MTFHEPLSPLSGAGPEVPPAELVPKPHLRELSEWLCSLLGPLTGLIPMMATAPAPASLCRPAASRIWDRNDLV